MAMRSTVWQSDLVNGDAACSRDYLATTRGGASCTYDVFPVTHSLAATMQLRKIVQWRTLWWSEYSKVHAEPAVCGVNIFEKTALSFCLENEV